MSVERALVTQAGSYMLAAEAQAIIAAEVNKGCDGQILAHPVALEPAYSPIMAPKDFMALQDRPGWVHEAPPCEEDLVRYRVWISPNQPFNWNCFELFLKQLALVTNRVGLELAGNQERIVVSLLCHRADAPIVATAFRGKLRFCRLSPQESSPLAGLEPEAWEEVSFNDYYPAPPYSHLLTRPEELHTSPYECLITAMANLPKPAVGLYQALFQPVSPDHNWHRNIETLLDLEYVVGLSNGMGHAQHYLQQAPSGSLQQMAGQVETKAHNDKPFFCAACRLAVVGAADGGRDYLRALAVFSSLFQHGGRPLSFLTEADYRAVLSAEQIRRMFLQGLAYRPGFLLNSAELTGLVHFPPTNIVEQLGVAMDTMETLPIAEGKLTEGTLIGTCSMAGKDRPVCIPSWLRMGHAHLIGRTDTGKSTLEEHMVVDDILSDKGVTVLDPHGDLVQRLLGLIPEEHADRVIYFNPGDPDWVPIWNPMQRVPGQDIGRMADDLIGVLKSFVTGWGDRMEHILRHSIFALLHLTGSTFLDITDLLRRNSVESKTLRQLILDVVENQEARQFWQHDFEDYHTADLGPAKHKLSKLLVSGTVSLMLSQPHSAFNFQRVMDEGMIFLGNLSNLGTEVRGILGGTLLTTMHTTALARSAVPPEKRRPHHAYIDEAHRFVTDSLEEIIAETRKYRVSLTLGHQYLRQFSSAKTDALSSVGTAVVFNVDSNDAAYLAKDFRGLVEVKDILNLKQGQAIVRCGTEITRITTPKPLQVPEHNCRERIIQHSHQRYCLPAPQVRQLVERRLERANKPFEPLVAMAERGRPGRTTQEPSYEEY
jgi:hypothetical protein